MSKFSDLLRIHISPVLRSKNMFLECCGDLHAGKVEACLYKKNNIKVLIYYSERDGEVNALIGPESANGKDIYSKEWSFIRSLVPSLRQKSIEDLLSRVSKDHVDMRTQIDEIAQLICEDFDEIQKSFSKKSKGLVD